jgi:hypothetical protein
MIGERYAVEKRVRDLPREGQYRVRHGRRLLSQTCDHIFTNETEPATHGAQVGFLHRVIHRICGLMAGGRQYTDATQHIDWWLRTCQGRPVSPANEVGRCERLAFFWSDDSRHRGCGRTCLARSSLAGRSFGNTGCTR